MKAIKVSFNLLIIVIAFALMSCQGKTISGLEGSGDKDAPYIIESLEDLERLSRNIDYDRYIYVELNADLDMSDYDYPDNAGIYEYDNGKPLYNTCATVIEQFYGNFEGNGYTISNFTIDAYLYDYDYSDRIENNFLGNVKSRKTGGYLPVGFFGEVKEGTIINDIHFDNAEILIQQDNGDNSKLAVGILVGYLSMGEDELVISNSTLQGRMDINGNESHIGGFVGKADWSVSIENSVTILDVTNNSSRGSLGGLIGYFGRKNTITNSASSLDANILNGSYTGGLVGYGYGYIIESFSDVDIKIANQVNKAMNIGGIIGHLTEGYIENVYAAGSITGSLNGEYAIGGIAGSLISTSNSEKSYINGSYNLVNMNVSGRNSNDSIYGVAGKVNNQTDVRSSYYSSLLLGYDGESNQYGDKDAYSVNVSPRDLRNQTFIESSTILDSDCWTSEDGDYPTLVNTDFTSPKGFQSNKIGIKTIYEFNQLENKPWAIYEIQNDIDFNEFNQKPLFSEQQPFTGKIYGNMNKLENISISNVLTDSVQASTTVFSIINYANGAEIYDLYIKDAYLNNESYLINPIISGILIGEAEHTKISHVMISGLLIVESISGTNTVGGAIGQAKGIEINDLIVDVDVISRMTASNINNLSANNVGGIIGSSYIENYDLYNVFFTGIIINESIAENEPNTGMFIGRIWGGESNLNHLYYKNQLDLDDFGSVNDMTNVSLHMDNFSIMIDSDYIITNEEEIFLIAFLDE
jgi:hypothetical protein